ncbi:MAG: hypothetical protein M3Q50_02890, partial [Chloroflexota bacterium]|nr:hypothetical protein [Chloroflexota bacterium]
TGLLFFGNIWQWEMIGVPEPWRRTLVSAADFEENRIAALASGRAVVPLIPLGRRKSGRLAARYRSKTPLASGSRWSNAASRAAAPSTRPNAYRDTYSITYSLRMAALSGERILQAWR